MARSIGSVLAFVALVGFSKAFNISEFMPISNGGVSEDWVKMGHNDTEDFGLAYGNDKLYLVSRRNGTAVRGGIVSTLVDGKWKHASFSELDDKIYHDQLFTLAGRMFMLTAGENDGRIVFNNLLAWDDDRSMWMPVGLNIPDKDNVFTRLERGPSRFISVNVPDQDGKLAFLVATDHETTKANSSTSFSKLLVDFDADKKPLNASIIFIKRVDSNVGQAVIDSAIKGERLYPLVAKFTVDAHLANITIDYAIDLDSNSRVNVSDVKLDNGTIPVIDFTEGGRILQFKDIILILSPHGQDSSTTSLVWDLDLVELKMRDVNAKFLDLYKPVFAIDQKNSRLLTADLKKGAFAAKITA